MMKNSISFHSIYRFSCANDLPLFFCVLCRNITRMTKIRRIFTSSHFSFLTLPKLVALSRDLIFFLISMQTFHWLSRKFSRFRFTRKRRLKKQIREQRRRKRILKKLNTLAPFTSALNSVKKVGSEEVLWTRKKIERKTFGQSSD